MEHTNECELNILHLPEEVLMRVVEYTSESSYELSQTCKFFYSLVCSLTSNIKLDLCFKQICDDETYNSVINTERKFTEVTINLCQCQKLCNSISKRIEDIIEKFGPKILKIWNSIQSKPTEISDHQLYSFLSRVPTLEDFQFCNIYVRESSDALFDKELNLNNLESLTLDYCIFDDSSPKVLLLIPHNIIKALVFTFEPYNEELFQSFFEQQKNIKKLEIFENDKINFQHLDLEHLKISSDLDFPSMIRSQPNLKYLDFAITWVTDEVILEVCKLKHLRVLKTLIDLVSCRAFKGLCELTQLKELRIDSHSPFDAGYLHELANMRYMELEKVSLIFTERKINPEIVIQIANNFHHLKHIELINRSIAVLDTLIQNCPSLESILLDFYSLFGAPEDIFQLSNDKITHNLKQLVVKHVNINEQENGDNLLRLLAICPRLERIMLSKLTSFNNEKLHAILDGHKNLAFLSLDVDMDFTNDSIILIHNYGKKLRLFHLESMKKCVEYVMLKEIFKEKFPVINMYKYSSNEVEIIMKKRNIEDWHLNFKLMDHF